MNLAILEIDNVKEELKELANTLQCALAVLEQDICDDSALDCVAVVERSLNGISGRLGEVYQALHEKYWEHDQEPLNPAASGSE